jgi:hypothetical protein
VATAAFRSNACAPILLNTANIRNTENRKAVNGESRLARSPAM